MNAANATSLVLSRTWDGPRHLLLGYRLLFRPGVRRFMLIPLLGNVVLYVGAFGLAFWGLDWALDRWLPAAVDWLRWLLYPLLAVLMSVFAFFTFTLIGNLVLAPFNGLLSEQVERSLTGNVARPRNETLSQAMGRSLRLAVWRLGFIALRIGAVFLLGLIPLVGVIALPVGVLLGAWLLALEFSDAPLGNWGWTLTQQRELVRANRAGFVAFGLTAMGLSLVPVLNFALIPAAIAGMTAYCLPLRDVVRPAAEPVAAG